MPTSSLVDQNGRAISYPELEAEVAPVSSLDGRQAFSGHLAFGMDPSRLGAVLRSNDNGSTLDWMVLAEEIEELYPHYMAVLSKRKRQVCQLPITVHPAGDDAASLKQAELVEEWIATGVLADALFDVCDAMGKGYSIAEIMWSSQPGRVVPRELLYRPQRFFEIDQNDGTNFRLRTGAGFAELAPHKFLTHRHRSKSGLVVRSGLTRVVAFLWMFSSYTLRDWAMFTQSYGLPIRVGRYGPDASELDKRVLWRAVSSIAGDVAAIVPKSMDLEFVADKDRAAGATLYEKRADWLNREVSKVVLGGTAGTEAISGGHAVGQEHRQAEADVERFDAQLLSTTITRQLVQPMVAFTFGPQERYPILLIGRPDEVPLQQMIAGVADLAGVGLKVKASEVRDRLGLSKPEAGDETIGGVEPVAAPHPVIPSLAVAPHKQSGGSPQGSWLGTLLTLHTEAPPEIVEAMTQRLADDAAGALAGMTDAIRAEFEAAESMADLSRRLQGLSLPQGEFVEAMTRGAALAQLVGQASLVAELGRRR